jgi:hypothetical protein
MVLVASFLCLSVAHANLTPSKDRLNLDRARPAAPKVESSTPAEDDGKLVISDKTEVMLDGNVCKLQDVPKDAEVVHLEVDKDKKSVLKIHFRTSKK